MQAAVGVEQLNKLEAFTARRKENFAALLTGFSQWERYFLLPKATVGADPSWFAFPVTVRHDAPFSRTMLTRFLADAQIETRSLFAGNITRQPAYAEVRYRCPVRLSNTDWLTRGGFILGVAPCITAEHVEFMLHMISTFIRRF
jgi:CDP-6-deoxy-D-xylo-4-hexulose-3-dehydrase